MDKHTFKASIMPLFNFYKQEATKEMLNIYYGVLGDYDPIILDTCVKDAFATCKWMPKPVEINEIRNRLTGMNYVNIFDAIDMAEDIGDDRLLLLAINKKD